MAKLNMFTCGYCTCCILRCIESNNITGAMFCGTLALINLVFGLIGGNN